jgi:hypothetical protein
MLTTINMQGVMAALRRSFITKYVSGSLEVEALAASIMRVSRGLTHDYAPRSAVVTGMADMIYQITEARHDAHQCLLVSNNLTAALQQEGFWGVVTKVHDGQEINCVSCNMAPERAYAVPEFDVLPYTRSAVTRRPSDVQGYADPVSGVSISDTLDALNQIRVSLEDSMIPIIESVLPVLSEAKRPHVQRVLDNARRLKGTTFKYGWFNDWRDRWYSDSGGVLSHQNCKFSRSLICTPEEYKVTEAGRAAALAWIEREYGTPPTVINAVEEVRRDPKEGIMKVRCWMEWRRLKGGATTSRFIAYPDASCSGLQFMSIFLRDRRIAEATNLVGSAKSDLYTMVAENTGLGGALMSRTLSKPTVQVISYGGGAPKCAAHTAALVPSFAALDGEEQLRVAEEYFESFFSLFPTAKWLIRNTQTKAAAMAAQNRHWSFVTPMGTKATAYKLIRDPEATGLVQIGHSRYGSNTSVTPLVPDWGIAGALANMTHSADAAVCAAVVCAGAESGRTVMPIHDSFGVRINDIDWVREQYLHQMRECWEWAPKWLKANGLSVRDCGLHKDEITNTWALA